MKSALTAFAVVLGIAGLALAAAPAFEKLDANGDGTLTKSEAAKASLRRAWIKRKANSTPEMVRAWVEKMRSYHKGRKRSPESRARIAAAKRKTWAAKKRTTMQLELFRS